MTSALNQSVISQITGLAVPTERARFLQELCSALGARAVIVFIRDPELGVLLPAPGFPQTLPSGKIWKSFLDRTIRETEATGDLPWDRNEHIAHGIAGHDGSALVVLGTKVSEKSVEEISLLLPMLACALAGEQAIAQAQAQTAVARQIAEQANKLSHNLDAARRAAQQEVAARIRAEEEVRNANLTLEKRVNERTESLSQALAQLEEFSYTVSHDLRAPLRSISSFAHIVMEDYGPLLPEDGQKMLKQIWQSSNRMNQLTHDILSFTRVSQSDFPLSNIRLDDLLDEVTGQFSQNVPEVELKVRKPLGNVLAHEGLLAQCLNNLLDNAVKYSRPEVPPAIQIWAQTLDGHLRLNVKDNGVGIPEKYQDKIFQIFERLDTRKPGTGVGLAIVKRAISRMNGHIGVESTPNRGSTFYLDLLPG